MESFADWLVFFCILPFTVLINFFLNFKFKNLAMVFLSLFFLFWFCSVRVILTVLCGSIYVYCVSFFINSVKSKKLKFFLCFASVLLVLVLLIVIFGFMFAVEENAFYDFERIVVSLICMANISYIIDIYKNREFIQKSLVNFLTYVIMFPKLFLGPVVFYYKFSEQLNSNNRKIDFNDFSKGVELFIVGFAKKIILANEFYEIYSFVALQTASGLSILSAWFGVGSGFLSLIFNFSGYSDMAVGLGKMLGFDLPRNSTNVLWTDSVTEFFKKFNCSVLSYLKFYIFPWWNLKFYGFKFLKTIMIVFFYAMFFGLSGSCFLTACYFLCVVFLEKCFAKGDLFNSFKYFRKLVTLLLLLIGAVFFQRRSVMENLNFLGSMFGLSGILIDFSFVFVVILLKFLVMVFALFCINYLNKLKFLKFKIFNNLAYLKSIVLIMLFVSSVVVSLSQV